LWGAGEDVPDRPEGKGGGARLRKTVPAESGCFNTAHPVEGPFTMDTANADFEAELRALLAEGRKVAAIKRYREEMGVGLAEAKQAVEAIERDQPPPAGEPDDDSWQSQVAALLEDGRKLQAIKLYRERTGAGIKEAREAVDALGADRGIVAPARSGCLGVVLLLALVLLAVLFPA
jgi:ribosomal protein L7/L12